MLPSEAVGARGWRPFLLGWITGGSSFLISLFWITTVTWAGWVLLALIVGVYHGIWALFAAGVLRPLGETGDTSCAWTGSFRNLLVALLAAAGWVGVEWLRGYLFSGFGWNTLGIALRENLPLIQIAGITGTAGLTFLCVLGSATAAIAAERFRREIGSRRSSPHLDVLLVILLVAGVFVHGVKKLRRPPGETVPLKVAGVQGNVPVYDYWNPECDGRILAGYVRQTRMALAMHPHLVVWPEASTPRPLLIDGATFDQVKGLAEGTDADFLIGSVHYEQSPLGDYNSAILLSDHARTAQIYNKVHLVPFGEYVPFRRAFPPLQWIVGKQVPYDFDPGKGPVLLSLSGGSAAHPALSLGPLICFEDTLGDLTRGFAALGAQLLITLTNDGWFDHSVATRQHLANAQLRTVETGLPLLRVADTGITCLVDSTGRIREKLADSSGNTFVEGILQSVVPVPLHPVPTFYTRHGDLFAHLCLVAALSSALSWLVKRRRP